ncbi:MAG: DUF3150 domain-containing protein [Desulfovibrio sp.]|uniref:DUF3150 domain-containing protein n=1 Tax=Desulfovibrio sp. TaxID=885 RepID=UPI00135EC7D1|nr:DUF3150 domain-containing protein [Desulfovibrio sp.]MTJ93959.1 DUF3150 domain-containing protein [Desulfovibrio sp.]
MSTNILENIDVFAVEVNIWSGEVVLRKTDFNLGIGGELPPPKLASLGTKRLIAREPLQRLHKIRSQVDDLLRVNSINLLKARGVFHKDTARLKEQIDKLRDEFVEHRDTELIPNVSQLQRAWRRQFPEYEDKLAEREFSPEEVRKRCDFQCTIHQIRESAREEGSLGERVKTLDEDLLIDIADEAEKLLDYILKQGNLTRKFANPLKRLRLKLAKFAFFNEAMIQPIVAAMDKVIDKIMLAKRMTDALQAEVVALVQMLADPDRMRKHGGQLASVISSQQIITNVPSPAPQPAPAVVQSEIVITSPAEEPPLVEELPEDLVEDPPADQEEEAFFAEVTEQEIALATVQEECLGF